MLFSPVLCTTWRCVDGFSAGRRTRIKESDRKVCKVGLGEPWKTALCMYVSVSVCDCVIVCVRVCGCARVCGCVCACVWARARQRSGPNRLCRKVSFSGWQGTDECLQL